MKLDGIRDCPFCQNRYKWYLLLNEHKSNYIFDVENISAYQCRAAETEEPNKDVYHLITRCPKCYNTEQFDYLRQD